MPRESSLDEAEKMALKDTNRSTRKEIHHSCVENSGIFLQTEKPHPKPCKRRRSGGMGMGMMGKKEKDPTDIHAKCCPMFARSMQSPEWKEP
jgi:hypothetical protein